IHVDSVRIEPTIRLTAERSAIELRIIDTLSGNSEVVILAYAPPESGPPGTRTQTEQILSLLPLPIGLEGRAPVALHASCAERQPPGCLVVFESTRLRGPAHPSCHR